MCNLKSNKTLKEILEYKKILKNLKQEDLEFVLFPSSLYLSFFYDAPYKIGSQNLSVYQSGSITGEILSNQLKSLKVSYVLINHLDASEQIKDVITKIKNATKDKLKVVLCIGEKERQTLEKASLEIIEEIHAIFSKLTKEEKENILLAYEPSWAINSGNIKNPEIIVSMVKKIKKEMKKTYELATPVLYGGGINIKNIGEVSKIDILDGYLLGNCANNPENILKIIDKI